MHHKRSVFPIQVSFIAVERGVLAGAAIQSTCDGKTRFELVNLTDMSQDWTKAVTSVLVT